MCTRDPIESHHVTGYVNTCKREHISLCLYHTSCNNSHSIGCNFQSTLHNSEALQQKCVVIGSYACGNMLFIQDPHNFFWCNEADHIINPEMFAATN